MGLKAPDVEKRVSALYKGELFRCIIISMGAIPTYTSVSQDGLLTMVFHQRQFRLAHDIFQVSFKAQSQVSWVVLLCP
jgi:hypothetical protein